MKTSESNLGMGCIEAPCPKQGLSQASATALSPFLSVKLTFVKAVRQAFRPARIGVLRERNKHEVFHAPPAYWPGLKHVNKDIISSAKSSKLQAFSALSRCGQFATIAPLLR
jgi:hypothetical protein